MKFSARNLVLTVALAAEIASGALYDSSGYDSSRLFSPAVCDILYLNAKEEPLSRIYSGLYYKKHASEWEWFNLFIYDTGNKCKNTCATRKVMSFSDMSGSSAYE